MDNLAPFHLVILIVAFWLGHCKIIHIHQNGVDRPKCLEDLGADQYIPQVFCKSLEYVATKGNYSINGVTIAIETSLKVKNLIIFQASRYVMIKGMVSQRTLHCNCNSSSKRGIVAINVEKFLMSNIIVNNCCSHFKDRAASLQLYQCGSVTIEGVSITQSKWSCGLMIVNSYKIISIHLSTFSYNGHKEQFSNKSLGGGIYLVLSQKVNISITDCVFEHNYSPDTFTPSTERNGNSSGGGLRITFITRCTHAKVYIQNCTFKGNIADWGAGLSIYLKKRASHNVVTVLNSVLTNNQARKAGGGALIDLGKLCSSKSGNIIWFKNTTFLKNKSGQFGGGMSITSQFSMYTSQPGELIQFINCSWIENYSQYGAAIDITPSITEELNQGFLPIPMFRDSFVIGNHPEVNTSSNPMHIMQGTFTITQFTVYFQGTQMFQKNWYSALYLTSGKIVLESNSSLTFHSNVGIKGGAIVVYAFSVISVKDNSSAIFINNSASQEGGAIYHISINQKDYLAGRYCFLHYRGERKPDKRHITFRFINNSASRGASIFSESLQSCYCAHLGHKPNNIKPTSLFEKLWSFQFDKSTHTTTALATGARYVMFERENPLETTPGNEVYLPLAMYDEFHQTIKSKYTLSVDSHNNVNLYKYYTVTNRTRILGDPNQNATIILSTVQSLHNIEYRITVKLAHCPPGFFYSKPSNTCRCSADVEAQSYIAIVKCNYTKYRAFILNGYWAGYIPNEKHHPDNLYTARYPSMFSAYKSSSHLMPNNGENLTQFFCKSSRKGIICGTCQNGYSPYYHAKGYMCGKNTLCKFGLLFYFLSEIVPVTLFFSIVMIFGVSFTSGSLNGFILFSQIMDTFSESMRISELYHNSLLIKVLQEIYQFIYGIFNFNFFLVFPFCLWEGAFIMDLLAFKYVTTTFAFILILLIVKFMNFSSKRLMCLKRLKLTTERKSSTIHGISTFIVATYAQCTSVSFAILRRVHLQGKPGVEPIPVSYYGGLPFLGKKHLLYAIPAIVVCLTFVSLPPVCLITYPAILHLLSVCGLSEHAVVSRILKFINIDRLKPLLDSNQGCYKDKLRFFSGIYFLYRVFVLLSQIVSDSDVQFFITVEFLALIMLGIHSIFQPYKLRKYNLIDSLIFLNFAVMNGITIIIKLSSTATQNFNITSVAAVQLVLIYIPIVCLLFMLTVKPFLYMCKKCFKSKLRKRLATEQISITTQIVTHNSIELRESLLS